jgi:AcrR family transcriptional regulator
MKIAAMSEVSAERRPQLTRQRVVAAAVGLADRDGIESVSMRGLAEELDIEAMSLYTHVRNKDDLLDGMVDAVIGEIPIDRVGADWKAVLRRMILGARSVLLQHPWAPRIIETRSAPGPAILRYFNTVIGILREADFATDQVHHALHILGSRQLGFTQEPYDDSEQLSPEAAATFAGQMAATFPYVAEMALAATHEGGLGGCDTDAEFEFALDFILDGFVRSLNA